MKNIAAIILSLACLMQCSAHKNDAPVSLDAWLENNSFEVSELTLAHSDQFSFLDEFIEGKNLIAAGEATHGTSEFFQIKNQIFKYLVENQGFEIYALEAGYYEAQKINEYITKGIGDPEQLVLSLGLWPWRTWEFVELINWMRDYNISNNVNLKFYGFDIGNTIWHSKDSVRNEVVIYAPELLSSYDSIIGVVFDKEQSRSDVMELLKEFEQDSLESDLPESTKFIIGLYSKEFESWGSDQNSRDRYMAEIINHIYLQEDGKRLFLSMHNYHLDKSEKYLGYQGKSDSTYISVPDRTTGFYLKEQYQNDYYAIGFEFNKGSFNVPYKLDEEQNLIVKPFEFEDAPDTLFAYHLSNRGMENYFIDINENVEEFHAINKLHQFGGFLPRSRNTNDIKLVDSYDGLIFVNVSTPSKRITP